MIQLDVVEADLAVDNDIFTEYRPHFLNVKIKTIISLLKARFNAANAGVMSARGGAWRQNNVNNGKGISGAGHF